MSRVTQVCSCPGVQQDRCVVLHRCEMGVTGCTLPADDPVQGIGTDVQSSFDIWVVQVEGGGGGVGTGGVQADGQVDICQTS